MAVKKITTPLTDEVVKGLRAGDAVEITGGHGLLPARDTVSTTASTIPAQPCDGLSMFRLLMFSAPPPLAMIVMRTRSPGTMLVWMMAGVLSAVLRRAWPGSPTTDLRR